MQARFQIKLHEKDRFLLLLIKEFFGKVSKVNTNFTVEFRVNILKELADVVIPHFEKYNLITNKYSDFVLFKEITWLMSKNLHTNLEGLQLVLNNRASLNRGLNEILKLAFPLTVPVSRTKIDITLKNLSFEWLNGFCSGEYNFFIATSRSYAWLRFSIGQGVRDVSLLEDITKYLKCGYISTYKDRDVCEYVVTKIDDIITYIIPLFDTYPIMGSKHKDYLYFKEAAYIIKSKNHLNKLGMDRILELKNSMNKK